MDRPGLREVTSVRLRQLLPLKLVERGMKQHITGVTLATYRLPIAGRDWTIRAVRDHDALLAAADRFAQFPFGLLLWDSAPALAEALAQRPELVRGRRLLELGAGVGLAGLVARHLGGEIRQTDHIEEALELCRINAQLNGVPGIDVAHADWNDWHDETLYDLIIGADVLYDRTAHAAILSILNRNLAPGGSVILTDPGRVYTAGFCMDCMRSGWCVSGQDKSALSLSPAPCQKQLRISVLELVRSAAT
jgi:predicted nicotinamide N-methyase